jgi:hypothetical protein
MISKAKWQTYIQKLAAIDEKAAEMIREYIDTNGLENSQELIDYAHGIVTKYGEASAELSCEMYDLMAKTQGAVVPPAEPADTATIDEIARGVQWGKYHSPNQIPSIVGRQTRLAGADTMIKNAIRDQVEWAWIPSGDTCAFCITLASRGWQRASKKVLKGDHAEHIHANCDCTFGIAFNEKGKREYDYIYDPKKYEDMYYGADGNTPKERINSIRRARYQVNKDYINAQKRDAYQARNFTLPTKTGNVTLKQGALTSSNDPDYTRRAAHADLYYEEIRNRKIEPVSSAIAEHTDLSVDEAKTVINHVFNEEHLFEDGTLRRFDTSYDMAESFQRIIEGKNIQEHDIILLKHELMEANLMADDPSMVYETAHEIVQRKYNYSEALTEYLKNNNLE